MHVGADLYLLAFGDVGEGAVDRAGRGVVDQDKGGRLLEGRVAEVGDAKHRPRLNSHAFGCD